MTDAFNAIPDWLQDIEPDWKILACIRGAEEAEQLRLAWPHRQRTQTLSYAIERITAERDGARLAAHDPALSMHQQDMAAMRGWTYSHALEILDEIGQLIVEDA